MSTNYYLKRNFSENDKAKMKEYIDNNNYESLSEIIYNYNPIHIGKKSCGWKFLFNFHNFEYFNNTKESVYEFLKSGTIIDEYQREISYDEFIYIMTNEKDDIDLLKYYTDKKYKDSRGPYTPYLKQYDMDKFKNLYNIDVNVLGEFYIDDMRFTTCTNFC